MNAKSICVFNQIHGTVFNRLTASDLERKRRRVDVVGKQEEERSKKKPKGGLSFRSVESYVETEVTGFYTDPRNVLRSPELARTS